MTNPTRPSSQESAPKALEGEPLDSKTERVMLDVLQAGLRHGREDKMAIADCQVCQDTITALRNRIAELWQEANEAGFISGQHSMADLLRPRVR